jgi:undecaprenyl-diphosphatase
MDLTFLKSIILGIVEGLTEFAPVSSTAHILISGKLLSIRSSEFFNLFTIAIQSGAIIAAVFFFFRTILKNLTLIPKIIVGFIPTAIAGILIQPFLSKIFASTYIIGITLIIGGVIFLFIRPNEEETHIKDISYKNAFIIGLTQILAFIPGVSRSGATLIGGTALKIPRDQIVVFSFLLGIPTILGASVVELNSIPKITFSEWLLILLGAITAFVTAILTIKWFIKILTKKPLSWFGWYRIVVGIIVLFFIK